MIETEKKPLSEANRIKLGGELAELERRLIAVEGERRETVTRFRLDIRSIRERMDSVSQQLTDGFFEEQFEVVEEFDDARFMVDVKRKDNGKRISARQMTEAERSAAMERRQGGLFDGKGKPTPLADLKEHHGKPLHAPVVDLAKHAKSKKPRKPKSDA